MLRLVPAPCPLMVTLYPQPLLTQINCSCVAHRFDSHQQNPPSLRQAVLMRYPRNRPGWRQTMKSNEQLKRDVEEELRCVEGIPSGAVHVQVDRGCVTLTGEVDWGAQRHAAEMAASRTFGVVGVMNRIAVKRDADPGRAVDLNQ